MTNLHVVRMPRFRPGAAAELAAYLLRWLGGRTDWYTVLKLVYKVERRALEKHEWPVIFDQMYSLPQGPVPDQVYRLLKGEISHPEWSEYIESTKPYASLKKPPKARYLSQAQLDIAREVIAENKGKSGPRLSRESHSLPEWNDPQGSSQLISYQTLLKVLGKSDAETQAIFDRLREEAELEDVLG